jgi:hypothetical protein
MLLQEELNEKRLLWENQKRLLDKQKRNLKNEKMKKIILNTFRKNI